MSGGSLAKSDRFGIRHFETKLGVTLVKTLPGSSLSGAVAKRSSENAPAIVL